MWFCHECNAEMRPITTEGPDPLCASCRSSFIEELPSDPNHTDDPRAFDIGSRLFASFGQAPDHAPERDRGPSIGLAMDPIRQLLGAVIGMPDPQPQTPSGPGAPGSATGRPTISIRRDSDGERSGRSRSGGMQFQFRSGSGSGGSGFGMFGGFGRRDERDRERQEPATIEEFLAAAFQPAPGSANAAGAQGARPSPLLQNMLMGLFGAGIGHPGVGMGTAGDGRWGDYALNQEALDQILTQLMEGNHAAPVPAPEDMIASWPRTILTPGNPLENQDCAVCKDTLGFTPPEPEPATSSDSGPQRKPTGDEIQPQEALTLPCKHSFHVECIEPWVKVKGTCPVCRFELVSQSGGANAPAPGNATGGGSGDGGNHSGSGGGSGSRNEPETEHGDREGGSPMPPGAYALD